MVSDHVGIRAELLLTPFDEEAPVPHSFVIPDIPERHRIDAVRAPRRRAPLS